MAVNTFILVNFGPFRLTFVGFRSLFKQLVLREEISGTSDSVIKHKCFD